MYQNILKTPNYDDYIATRGETKTSRYKYTKNSLNDHVKNFLNRSTQSETASDDYLKGQGLSINIPSIIIDIYTRLEILPKIKVSGHTDTLTEASYLIDEYTKQVKYKTKNTDKMLLINCQSNKYNFQVKYQSEWHLKQDVKKRAYVDHYG